MANDAENKDVSFDDAFDEALAADSEKPAVPQASGTAQDPPAGEQAADAGKQSEGDAAAVEAAAAGGEDTAKAGQSGEQPPASAEQPPEEAPEAKAARLEAENAALREAAKAPAKPAQTPEKPAPATAEEGGESAAKPAPPPEPKWYQPSEEETAALAEFQKEWPDQYVAVNIAIKQAAYNVAEYIFAQMAKVYNPALERFSSLSDAMQEQIQLTALQRAHSDYDEIHDKVLDWVEKLPTAFKMGAQHVLNNGTPEEVSELIMQYKAANQTATGAASAAAPVVATPKAQTTTELSAAAKKAAGKLQVVGSKRTTPIAPVDASDFDGAWQEALSNNG
jgi:hypothetical protein